MKNYIFTSESVSEGHPDKMADQISDSVLDAILAQDSKGRVACETLLTTGLVVVAGEITTSAKVNFSEIARETIKKIGTDTIAKKAPSANTPIPVVNARIDKHRTTPRDNKTAIRVPKIASVCAIANNANGNKDNI